METYVVINAVQFYLQKWIKIGQVCVIAVLTKLRMLSIKYYEAEKLIQSDPHIWNPKIKLRDAYKIEGEIQLIEDTYLISTPKPESQIKIVTWETKKNFIRRIEENLHYTQDKIINQSLTSFHNNDSNIPKSRTIIFKDC